MAICEVIVLHISLVEHTRLYLQKVQNMILSIIPSWFRPSVMTAFDGPEAFIEPAMPGCIII